MRYRREWMMRLLPVVGDGLVMVCAFGLAHLFRTLFGAVSWSLAQSGWALAATVAVQGLMLVFFDCHRIPWRFISARDTMRFAGALGLAAVVLMLIRLALPSHPGLRLSFAIIALNAILAFGLLVGVRLAVRLFGEGVLSVLHVGPPPRRVLLAGVSGVDNPVLREIRRQRPVRLLAVGLVDDDPANRQAIIQGVPVLGPIAELPEWLKRTRADEVIVTSGELPRETIRQVVGHCENAGVPVRIMPGVSEWLDGVVRIDRIRDVDISDLLGRNENALDDREVEQFFSGKRVWVTGAGGSIGGELARQIARVAPTELVLVERSELALYEVERELRRTRPQVRIVPALADIADTRRMEALFAAHPPSVVIHAAAHKHVPMMELNPGEAVKNNVLATRRLAELACAAGVEVFLLVSTDKAINPVSVMGATKRLAELAVRDLQRPGGTRFCAVRFGNVLGSSGSVIPLFREQIRQGGPVTVTHPDMRRYFMTIREAVRLVLHTAPLARGGEIFVLDMGEPVKVLDMAEEMIRLSGLRPYVDIPIVFTGIRAGEKLFEELDVGPDATERTACPQIFIGRIPQRPPEEVAAMLRAAGTVTEAVDREAVFIALRAWL